mmetsp:Transcript_45156/g.130756  ORF Transcript_45156/g.130756 Transcript_45156/m.130756 type:complete len:240 (+) Transcript_45156:923-1642(+)
MLLPQLCELLLDILKLATVAVVQLPKLLLKGFLPVRQAAKVVAPRKAAEREATWRHQEVSQIFVTACDTGSCADAFQKVMLCIQVHCPKLRCSCYRRARKNQQRQDQRNDDVHGVMEPVCNGGLHVATHQYQQHRPRKEAAQRAREQSKWRGVLPDEIVKAQGEDRIAVGVPGEHHVRTEGVAAFTALQPNRDNIQPEHIEETKEEPMLEAAKVLNPEVAQSVGSKTLLADLPAGRVWK